MNDSKETNDLQDTIKTVVKHPVSKIILISAATVGLIFISGLIMRVISSTVLHFKDLKAAIKK